MTLKSQVKGLKLSDNIHFRSILVPIAPLNRDMVLDVSLFLVVRLPDVRATKTNTVIIEKDA